MNNHNLISQSYDHLKKCMQLKPNSKMRRDYENIKSKNIYKSKLQSYKSQCFNQYFKLADKYNSPQMNDHKLTNQELEIKYQTNLTTGISTELPSKQQFIQRRIKNKFNKILQPPSNNIGTKIFIEFTKPTVFMIFLNWVFYFIAYTLQPSDTENLTVGIILLAIYIFIPLLSLPINHNQKNIQPIKNQVLQQHVNIIRDGNTISISSYKIIVGDLIHLQTGMKIPADIRVIQQNGLTIDNFNFTTRHQQISINSQESNQTFLQSKNIAFCSTIVKRGNGKGIVIATGNNTLIASLIHLTNSSITLKKELNKSYGLKQEANRITFKISIFSIFFAFLLFTLNQAFGLNPKQSFVIFGGTILSSAPINVIFFIAVSQFLESKKLSNLKIQDKSISSLINLGMTSCICIDKTEVMKQNTKVSSFCLLQKNKQRQQFQLKKNIHNSLYRQRMINKKRSNQTLKNLYEAVLLSTSTKVRKLSLKQIQQIRLIQKKDKFEFNNFRNRLISTYRKIWKNRNLIFSPLNTQGPQHIEPIRYSEQILMDNFEEQRSNQIIINQSSAHLEQQLIDNIQAQIPRFLYTNDPQSPIQTQMLKFFQKVHNFKNIRQDHPIAIDIQGNQCRIICRQQNIQITVRHFSINDSYFCVFIKGDPISVWSRCQQIYYQGFIENQFDNLVKIDDQTHSLAFYQNFNHLSFEGNKMVAFAKLHLSKNQYPRNYDQRFNMNEIKEIDSFNFIGFMCLQTDINQKLADAIERCRVANIRVVLMTEDIYPQTLQKIARKNNIISRKNTANNKFTDIKNKITFEEALQCTNSVIITDDMITNKQQNNQSSDQQRINFLIQILSPNQYIDQTSNQALQLQYPNISLESYLNKQQIVTAKTNSLQRLIIIKSLQQMGEIVTVLSSKKQDYQLIQNADIGITRKDIDNLESISDFVLQSDDINLLIDAIKQGRLVYDNFKKAFVFILCSHIPKVMPYFISTCLGIPLPIHAAFILYVSLFNEVVLGISLLFESHQIDLMTRKPRSKYQHLESLGLIFHAYGLIGWIQFFGAFLSYLVVANDFGFQLQTLINISRIKIVYPGQSDQFNPTDYYLGNSRAYLCLNEAYFIDWSMSNNAIIDLRQALMKHNLGNGICIIQTIKFGQCKIQQISSFTNKPICYTTQAIKYSTSAYFYGLLICQFVNLFACRTRKYPFYSQGLSNKILIVSIIVSGAFFLLIGYFQGFNYILKTRDNIFIHYGTPALPFAIFQLLLDEIRKFLFRKLKFNQKGISHWFVRAASW